MVTAPAVVKNSVYLSGSDSAAMAPLAPGLFSTATVSPSVLCILSAINRAVRSAVPPAVNATISRTGRLE